MFQFSVSVFRLFASHEFEARRDAVGRWFQLGGGVPDGGFCSGAWPKEQSEAQGMNKTDWSEAWLRHTRTVFRQCRHSSFRHRGYKQFDLIGKEMCITVDMSGTECGLNGTIYFMELDKNGDKGVGDNNAGAATSLWRPWKLHESDDQDVSEA